MEELKESLMGMVIIFIIKLIIAMVMDLHEREESVVRVMEVSEGEYPVSIEYHFLT